VIQETLHKRETANSEESHGELAWEPHWVEGRFSCLMKCLTCKNPSAVSGTYSAAEMYVDTGEGEPEMVPLITYTPTFFSDAPHVIEAPDAVPANIVEELETSFKLYWVSPEACANSKRPRSVKRGERS
jgi:hypothetical protein